MNKFARALFPFLILCSFSNRGRAQETADYKTPDPLASPLQERQEFYRKQNLVANSSFEDSGMRERGLPLQIPHWTIVGKNVALTTRSQNDSDSEAAASINHAIRIMRSKAEVHEWEDNAEGVLSDFIKVIPGNYRFDFDISLENIYPATDRFDTRIGKGIDIRLAFFDENKNPIPDGYYFEYLGKPVDNSFKGFAFSNFFYIDRFAWAKVNGRSWNYPFSEGDLPAKCRYVRIFAGLSCSGTMWIDNIDFRLSKWNFTPANRVDSFFTRNYTLSQLLIPTPKKVSNEVKLDLRKRLVLVRDGESNAESRAAISLLRKKFFPVYGDSLNVYDSEKKSGASAKEWKIIFLNAGDKEWTASFDGIRNQAEGYFIKRKANRIFIGANEPKGFYYAATTLSQLIDENKSELDYVDVVDFPDFSGRSTVLMGYQNDWAMDQDKSLSDSAKKAMVEKRLGNLEQQISDIDFYAFYKINLLYDNYFQYSKRWWLPGDFYTSYFRQIGQRVSAYGSVLETAVQVNPYFHINMEQRVDTLTDSLVRIFAHGTEDGFNKVLNVLKPALDAGAKTVMYCADDYIPHRGSPRGEYTLFNPLDKAQFINLADAQCFLLNKLKKWLDRNYGPIRLEFVPAQYNNFFTDYTRGTAESYFHDLTNHLDSSVVIVWTGNSIRSMSYDAADILRFADLINRKPMVWDNSPYARIVERANGGYPANYPGKSVLCNLVEPFDIQYPENFPSLLDGRYYSNLGGFGEIAKIKYLTFTDFAWNTKAYSPEFSLYKALAKYIGAENGKKLLAFNQCYFEFMSLWAQLKMEKAHDNGYHCSEEERSRADAAIDKINSAYGQLKNMPNQTLVKELDAIRTLKIGDWKKLSK